MPSAPRHVVFERDLTARAEPGDTVSVAVAFDASSGSPDLEQRLLRFAPGRSRPRGPGEAEEVLFVLSGAGTLLLDGDAHELGPETAAYVAPQEHYQVENPGPGELAAVSVLLPSPPPAGSTMRRVTVGLAEQESQDATTDREFRTLFDPHTGCRGATQFVGYIPTVKAPTHYHLYDEVIYVLDGEGILHVAEEHTSIARGSCIHLSPRLEHCLENTGDEEMRVLGVFRPAGSPAEAYLPDGTPAYATKK